MKDKEGVYTRVVFLDLLAVLFIGLKLTDIIAWRWLWVLSPLWVPFTVPVIAILLAGLFVIIKNLIDKTTSIIKKITDRLKEYNNKRG